MKFYQLVQPIKNILHCKQRSNTMGIKFLRTLLTALCVMSIKHFSSIQDFMINEKNRLYREYITKHNVNNPIKQMQIREQIQNKPYFIGIDAYLFAFIYKRVFKRIELGFMRQILLTLSAGMIPIYVFDGSSPEQKKKTVRTRQSKKQKLREKLENFVFSNDSTKPEYLSKLSINDITNHINNMYTKLDHFDNSSGGSSDEADGYAVGPYNHTEDNLLFYNLSISDEEYKEFVKLSKKCISVDYRDIQNLKKFLDLLKIPHITAEHEADDLMAYMYKKNIIQACQSNDMDMLPKGCGNVIHIEKNGVYQYILEDILTELKMKHDQFVDLCILLGSDYGNNYLSKLKSRDLYDMYINLSNPSIESFVQYYSTIDPAISLHLQEYQDVRRMFISSHEPTNDDKIDCNLAPIRIDTIIEYFGNMDIHINDKYVRKMKNMVKNINDFIMNNQSISSPIPCPTNLACNVSCYLFHK